MNETTTFDRGNEALQQLPVRHPASVAQQGAAAKAPDDGTQLAGRHLDRSDSRQTPVSSKYREKQVLRADFFWESASGNSTRLPGFQYSPYCRGSSAPWKIPWNAAR